jgi:hypothetical protein
MFASYLSGPEMDRLYYYGMYLAQGKDSKTGMAEHIAIKPNSIRKSAWERLNLATKRKLNDPEYVVSLARCNAKPIRKPVRALTGLQLNQIIGDKTILPPEQQLPKIHFTQSKQDQQYMKETPEDGSVCERTKKILLADTKQDLILVSENHRQQTSFGIMKRFLRENGYVVYKIDEENTEAAG